MGSQRHEGRHHTRLAAALLAAMAAAACGGGGDSTSDRPTVALFTKNQINPYFQSIREGADSAASQVGARVTHFIPTRPDSIPEQMSQIEDVIVRRPGAVAFIPVDSNAMVPGVEKLNVAGIPVVNVTDHVAGGDVVSFVGCDEYRIAASTSRYLLETMGGRGSVVILEGVPGSSNNAARMRGFTDTLTEFPDVTLLASQPANFQRLQALQVMENLLQSHRQLDGVLALNDSMALGAVEALEAARRQALVVGINGTQEAVEAVQAGRLLASGDCDGFLHGCFGVLAAVKTIRGEPVPAEITFPVVVIDRENASSAGVLQEGRSCPTWEAVVSVEPS